MPPSWAGSTEAGILGIIFTGGGEGEFRFRIDDVRLLAEVPGEGSPDG